MLGVTNVGVLDAAPVVAVAVPWIAVVVVMGKRHYAHHAACVHVLWRRVVVRGRFLRGRGRGMDGEGRLSGGCGSNPIGRGQAVKVIQVVRRRGKPVRLATVRDFGVNLGRVRFPGFEEGDFR